MCRHLAWLGPPVGLAALLLDPPHSLLRQSYAPTDMRCGAVVNADGFGAGWYPAHPGDEGPGDKGAAVAGPAAARAPVRYRRATPLWADTCFADLAREVRSGAVLAAVRSATTGMPVVETACAPFTTGPWLFSHNGMIAGWPERVAGLAATLPVVDMLTLDAPTDSALLWALVRHRLRAGDSLGEALTTVVAEVLAAAPGSRLNLLTTDGTTLAATAVYHALWFRAADDSVLVCSEPTDDGAGWHPVPDGHLLTATRTAVTVAPIPEGAIPANPDEEP